MATDVGSMTPELKEHGFRIKIGRKGLRQTQGNPQIYLGALTFPL
jgi:hypothetical protein